MTARASAGLALLALASCAQPSATVPEPSAAADQPTEIVVRDFAVDPLVVQLDGAALGGRGRSTLSESDDTLRAGDAATARDMVATTLVFRLKQLGFAVRRAPADEPPDRAAIVIDGRLDRVDEGDRARRRADPDQGRAVVSGEVQVLATRGDGAAAAIASFADGSDAHRPHGLPGASAAEAAALAVGGIRARELLRASISAESRRLGNAFADQIKILFVQKGLLPNGA